MPRVFRRTPASQEAMHYSYGDLLKDAVRGMLAGGAAQSRRALEGRMTEDDYRDMLLGGVSGSMKFTKSLSPKMLLETLAAEKKFTKLGMKYDAYVNQIHDKPEFAYHQWTFLGEGPLKSQTLTTKGTSMREVEEMVADRMKKFIANPMYSNILK